MYYVNCVFDLGMVIVFWEGYGFFVLVGGESLFFVYCVFDFVCYGYVFCVYDFEFGYDMDCGYCVYVFVEYWDW